MAENVPFSFTGIKTSDNHFGCLRVINEDRVAAHTGFGTHSHRVNRSSTFPSPYSLSFADTLPFVFSKHSKGNTEILSRGHIQPTSAGTGISHSETPTAPNPFIPSKYGLYPSLPVSRSRYLTRFFSDKERTDNLRWVRVVASVSAEGVKKDLRGSTFISQGLRTHRFQAMLKSTARTSS
ncbi:hypothetical protein D9758_004951 [Tetrapyrgos nigripes]|uniref:Uncharacterized protein n=1 Tax=Tetrapyrgos nigripes TaxID=182062 RepID=A0A8H5GW97_9AGAR|nr:hypothetical protein D9758_004951 [Tetrapyrgos nigripes]